MTCKLVSLETFLSRTMKHIYRNGAFRYISVHSAAHFGRFQCISVHSDTFWCIPVHSGAFQCIAVYSGACRCMPVHSGAFWSMSVHSGVFRCMPVHSGACRFSIIITNFHSCLVLGLCLLLHACLQVYTTWTGWTDHNAAQHIAQHTTHSTTEQHRKASDSTGYHKVA